MFPGILPGEVLGLLCRVHLNNVVFHKLNGFLLIAAVQQKHLFTYPFYIKGCEWIKQMDKTIKNRVSKLAYPFQQCSWHLAKQSRRPESRFIVICPMISLNMGYNGFVLEAS